jgi:sugar phosphate isomerase/epimerase
MSTTQSDGIEATLRGCRPAEIEPIVVDAADLESTAPEHLRDLKAEFSARGYQPVTLSVAARFDGGDTLATQREADRLRELVRTASFLGAGRIEIRLDEIADQNATEPALSALAERARREGVELVRVDDGSAAA